MRGMAPMSSDVHTTGRSTRSPRAVRPNGTGRHRSHPSASASGEGTGAAAYGSAWPIHTDSRPAWPWSPRTRSRINRTSSTASADANASRRAMTSDAFRDGGRSSTIDHPELSLRGRSTISSPSALPIAPADRNASTRLLPSIIMASDRAPPSVA